MGNDEVLELIDRQIVGAQGLLEARRRRGENPADVMSLLRCLRLSLRAFAGGIDPDDEAATTFILSVAADGRFFLRRDHHLARLSGSWLRSLLRDGAIALEPGQCLLVEPSFAQRAVEESLGDVAAEDRLLERRRAEVQTALRQSTGPWKAHLQNELCRLDLERADLPIRRAELRELHVLTARAA